MYPLKKLLCFFFYTGGFDYLYLLVESVVTVIAIPCTRLAVGYPHPVPDQLVGNATICCDFYADVDMLNHAFMAGFDQPSDKAHFIAFRFGLVTGPGCLLYCIKDIVVAWRLGKLKTLFDDFHGLLPFFNLTVAPGNNLPREICPLTGHNPSHPTFPPAY